MTTKQQELIEYATEGNVAKLEELVQTDLEIDAVGSSGFPALHHALRAFPHNLKKDTLGCVKVLVKAGAKPFAGYLGGESPFATACIEGQLAAVEFFFTLGKPDLDLRLEAGTSLLDEMTIKLKNRPVNISSPAVTKAVDGEESAYLQIAELLIKQGADVHSQNTNEQTALHTASGVGVAPMVELLLKYGADVNHKDKTGLSCLHYASRGGFLSTMTALINAGADLNAQDNWGFTPAHEAVMSKDAGSLQILADNGTDFSIGLTKAYDASNPIGFSPLDMAKSKSLTKLIEIMEGATTSKKSEAKPSTAIELKEIPYKGWTWGKTEYGYEGADMTPKGISWYTHSENRQGGGASTQTYIDFIVTGPNHQKVPENIVEEIREYILQFKK